MISKTTKEKENTNLVCVLVWHFTLFYLTQYGFQNNKNIGHVYNIG